MPELFGWGQILYFKASFTAGKWENFLCFLVDAVPLRLVGKSKASSMRKSCPGFTIMALSWESTDSTVGRDMCASNRAMQSLKATRWSDCGTYEENHWQKNYMSAYEGNHSKANRHYLATKMVKGEKSETLKQTCKRNSRVIQSEIPNWIMVT